MILGGHLVVAVHPKLSVARLHKKLRSSAWECTVCRRVQHRKKPRIYKVALALGDYLKVCAGEVVAALGFEVWGLAPSDVRVCVCVRVWVDA